MAQMFKAAKPPSSALCEKVLVLGVSVETLMSTPHTESLVLDITHNGTSLGDAFHLCDVTA